MQRITVLTFTNKSLSASADMSHEWGAHPPPLCVALRPMQSDKLSSPAETRAVSVRSTAGELCTYVARWRSAASWGEALHILGQAL